MLQDKINHTWNLASVPGLPRSVRVLIMRRRQTFEKRFSNVCRLRTIKTRTERGRPGTEATWNCLSVFIGIRVYIYREY